MSKRGVIFFADATILLLCLIGFYHVWQKAGLPIIFSSNSLVIEKAVSDRFDTNIFSGENVLSINGYRIETQEDVEFILDGLNINDEITLLIEKNGITRSANITSL